MEIIGLAGFARVGKDTAANVLVEEFGFTKIAFADKLKEFLYTQNPIVGTYGGDIYYLQELIDDYGWEGAKDTLHSPEVRRLLQRTGTEAGRGVVGDNVWVDALLGGLDDDAKIVVPDCRFLNEIESVRSKGGYMWRVVRSGVDATNGHVSEGEHLKFGGYSLTLDNNGSEEEFEALVAREYKSRRYTEWC